MNQKITLAIILLIGAFMVIFGSTLGYFFPLITNLWIFSFELYLIGFVLVSYVIIKTKVWIKK
ncbi:MAG: hypothetical protein V1859_09120 [archaeon]